MLLTENEYFGNVPTDFLVIKSFWNKTEGNRGDYLGFRNDAGAYK
jgi:hypothetical protein